MVQIRKNNILRLSLETLFSNLFQHIKNVNVQPEK